MPRPGKLKNASTKRILAFMTISVIILIRYVQVRVVCTFGKGTPNSLAFLFSCIKVVIMIKFL